MCVCSFLLFYLPLVPKRLCFFFSFFFFFFVVVYLFVVFLFPASTSPFRITVRGDALVQAGKGAARDSRCGIVELSTTHALFPSFFFLSLRNAEALSSEPTVERKKSILGKLPFFFFSFRLSAFVSGSEPIHIYIYTHIAQPVVDLSFLLHFYLLPPLFFFFFFVVSPLFSSLPPEPTQKKKSHHHYCRSLSAVFFFFSSVFYSCLPRSRS